MIKNKIINCLLLAGALICLIILIFWYIQYQEINVTGSTALISCLIAFLKPGKMPPPFEYYRESYDVITENSFRNKRDSEMLRMGIYWFNRKKYKKAIKQFDKLLVNGDLFSSEREIVKLFKDNCILRMKPGQMAR